MNVTVKRLLCILLVFAILITLAGCEGERDYTYCELGFSLPRAYREFDASGDYDMAFRHRDGTVIGIRRFSFDAIVNEGILPTHSPLSFAEIYRERIEVSDASPIFEYGDIPYFTYTLSSAAGRYVYMPTFYRTPYAYVVIILVSKNELNDGGRVEFLEICESVYILPDYI